MKYLRFTFALLFSFLSCTSCDPENSLNQCEHDYVFILPINLSPASDTFRVGDKISIDIDFPVEMEEENSENFFDLTNFPFNVEIGFTWIDTLIASGADQDVNFFPKSGEIELRPLTGGETAVLLSFFKEEGRFRLNLDVQFKKAGLLAMGFDANIHKYFEYDLDKDCKNEKFRILFQLNGQTDNNYDLLQWSLDEQYLSYTKEAFDEAGGYIFRIEE